MLYHSSCSQQAMVSLTIERSLSPSSKNYSHHQYTFIHRFDFGFYKWINDVRYLPFFNFIRASTARRLHMSLTHWSFILMAIHLGLHLQSMLIPIQKRIKKSHFPHILMYIPYVLAIYGIVMFINYQWVDYLFILNEFLFSIHL